MTNTGRTPTPEDAGLRSRLRYALGAVLRRVVTRTTVTEPPTNAVFERDVAVVMRDGVRLRVNVFRPDDDQQHPVILSAHPYGKDRALPKPRRTGGYRAALQYHVMQSAPLTHSAWTGWEAPDPAYWVERGYAVINADLRGFGTSEGVGELLSEQEGTDCYDLIEWAARQRWSTGKVGMSGVSYLAITQWAAAATRPPHLAAICPWEGFSDLYRDFARPGGIRENGFLSIWGASLRLGGHRVDIGAQVRARPLHDAWWAGRDRRIEDIEVPALICASFSDHALHSRGSFEAFRRIASEHKWLYTHRGQKWATYYSDEALAVQQQFFDHFLRGQDTGVLDVGGVRVEVREDAETVTAVRHTSAWPPPQTQWRVLHLACGGAGALVEEDAAAAGVSTFAIRNGRVEFSYRFAQDTEVVGPMVLRVTVSVQGADDVALFAGVRKFRDGAQVGFNGSYGLPADLVTHGMLLASHRSLDPERSLPYLPFHPHDRREPLRGGELVEVDLGLLPSATLFRAGEQMRLDLQGRWFFSRNPLIGQFPPAYQPPTRTGTCTVHAGTLTIPTASPAPDASGTSSWRPWAGLGPCAWAPAR